MTVTKRITELKYRNKVVANGLLIGYRDRGYQLRKSQMPCWAKDMSARTLISEVIFRKRNGCDIYINKSDLKPGNKIMIADFKDRQNPRRKFEVMSIDGHQVTLREYN